jgi:peptidyl-prolyl cis-trans isomerase D
MALIGKIREKSALIVIVIGLALLAFILTDWQSMTAGSGGQEMGVVGGQAVNVDRYNEIVQAVMQQDQQQAQQSGREYTVREQKMSEQRAWSGIVEETVLAKEFEALGIEVTDKEFESYLFGEDGFTLMPDIAQSFADPATGIFNPTLLEKRIKEMEDSNDENVSKQWENNKKSMKEARKSEKYFQILAQGVYVTKLEAKEEYKAQRELKNISYVMRRYTEIPDDQIKVSDKELKDYYEAHKNEKKYEATAGRDVKYFDVQILPSAKDSAAFYKVLNTLKSEFEKTTQDSVFMVKNTESMEAKMNRYALPYRVQGDPEAKGNMIYPVYMDTVFKTASINQVVGPYSSNGKSYIAKVIRFNNQFLTARHILISANKADTVGAAKAKKQTDSIFVNLTKDNFEEMVTKFSQDQGSVAKGGKYENFLEDEFVPEFSKFCIDNPVGKIGIVQTQFGYHIIEVLEKKATKAPVLSVIEKTLAPSQDTETEISDLVHNLLYKYDEKIAKKKTASEKIALFDTLALKDGYFVRAPVKMLDESPMVNGFNTQFAEDRIIKLAYDKGVEIGTLVSAPIKDQGRYIIAIVSSIRKKGAPNFEDVEASMRFELIKEKKAKRFINQLMNEKTLEGMAKLSNTTVMQGEVTFGNPQIQGGGYEPMVVGSLFSGMKDGQRTLPLEGNQGVYVIRINKTVKAPATANYDAEKQQLTAAARGRMSNDIKQALIKKADVQDNRTFNRLGIQRSWID